MSKRQREDCEDNKCGVTLSTARREFFTILMCLKQMNIDIPLDVRKLLSVACIEKRECIEKCGNSNCCDKIALCGEFNLELYWHAHETKAWDAHFCSQECLEIIYYCSDFGFKECDKCERNICENNPDNGYISQFHQDRDDDDEIYNTCSRCYKLDVLSNGQPLSDYVGGRIVGEPFFVDDYDLQEAGYKRDIYCMDDTVKFNARASELIAKGNKVVSCLVPSYGFERRAWLYCKPKQTKRQRIGRRELKFLGIK